MNRKNGRKGRKTKKIYRRRDVAYTSPRTQHLPKYNLRCPILQREMDVTLRYIYKDYRIDATDVSITRFGLTEFDGRLPAYLVRLFAIYKYAKILGLTITVDLAAGTQEPLFASMGVLPLEEQSLITDVGYIAALPRSITRETGGAAGMSRVRFKKTFNTAQEIGQIIDSQTGWQTYVQAINAGVQTNSPYVFFAVDATTGAVYSSVAIINVEYHLKLFELQRELDNFGDDASIEAVSNMQGLDKLPRAMTKVPPPQVKQARK